MATKRFKRLRRKKNEPLDVDITSLLDILVILLVFLLKSYNPTDLKLDVVKNITLPNSASKALGHTSTTVQVSSEHEFWIDNKKIGSLEKDNNEKYTMLHQKLTSIKEEEKQNRDPAAVTKDGKPKENKKINLVFDQSLPYSMIQKIMHTSALAGYTEYKFIVQGRYQ
jgi:biopolymer transport protein ExbD